MKFLTIIAAFLGVFFFAGSQSKANPATDNYIKTFSTLDNNLSKAWRPLWNDVTYAFNPYSPPEREINKQMALIEAIGGLDFETSQLWLRKRDKARQQFLDSPAGKSWVKKRAEARIVLRKNITPRAKALRRLTLRLRSISPVPNSLRDANDYVIGYSNGVDHLLYFVEKSVAKSTTDIYGFEEQAKLTSKYYNAVLNQLKQYKALPQNKVYVDG